jgi:hypothetical protein
MERFPPIIEERVDGQVQVFRKLKLWELEQPRFKKPILKLYQQTTLKQLPNDIRRDLKVLVG